MRENLSAMKGRRDRSYIKDEKECLFVSFARYPSDNLYQKINKNEKSCVMYHQ
jgi:hypothetical protein